MGVVIWNTACVVLGAVFAIGICIALVTWVPKHFFVSAEDEAAAQAVAGDGLSGVHRGLLVRVMGSNLFIMVVALVLGLVNDFGPDDQWSRSHALARTLSGLVYVLVIWVCGLIVYLHVPLRIRREPGNGPGWMVAWCVAFVIACGLLIVGFWFSHWWWVQGHS